MSRDGDGWSCCARPWPRTTADGTQQRCRCCGAYSPLPPPPEPVPHLRTQRSRFTALLPALIMPVAGAPLGRSR